MLKNLKNLVSRKASKVQKEREEIIKKSKNKKKKTKEFTPEQEPDILEEDVSLTKSETESTIISSQGKPKRKRQDEENLQPADSLNSMFGYFDKKFEAMQNQINHGQEKRSTQQLFILKVKAILYSLI